MGVAHAILWFGLLTVGSSSLADDSWVVRVAGTGLPVILSAPHGGRTYPDDVPDRDAGCWIDGECVWSHSCGSKDFSRCKATTVTDLNTLELTLEIKDELCRLCGACPTVIYTNIRRKSVDMNRENDQATFGVKDMEDAWETYHNYIEEYKSNLTEGGLLLDIHGHGHTIQRAEVGYLLSRTKLNAGDFAPDETSIKHLASVSGINFNELLRGEDSFGSILVREGYPAVPSDETPSPGDASYFSGGYITKVHGSRDGGVVDAIQIESARSHRDTDEIPNYGKALARTIKRYLESHYTHLPLPWLKPTTPYSVPSEDKDQQDIGEDENPTHPSISYSTNSYSYEGDTNSQSGSSIIVGNFILLLVQGIIHLFLLT